MTPSRIVQRIGQSRFIVPYIVGCALFMQMLDSTVVAMALPEMARALGEDPVRLNIAITSYLLSIAVFIPISGWIADRFGARLVFASAVALFTLSSAACGLASSLPELVAARLVQGMAGAMMVPVGRIVMLRSVSKADLMQATAVLTMPALLGPVLGPPIGGFVATYGSWRWIFLMNIPIGILGMILILLFIKDIREDNVPPLDWRGFVLSAVSLACLVSGFETVGRDAIAPQYTIAILLVGAVAAVLYVRHANRIAHPILDLKLMRIKTYAVAVIGGNFCRFTISATPFLLAMLLQVVFGLSAFAAGMISFIGALGALLGKFLITPLFGRFGFRVVLAANGVVMSLSIAACMLFSPETPHAVIMAVLFLSGLFRSIQMTGVNTLIYADLSQKDIAGGNTFASMMQQLAFSLGVGIAALAMQTSLSLRGGDTLEAMDVGAGFAVVAVCALASLIWFVSLPADAGAEVSKARIKQAS